MEKEKKLPLVQHANHVKMDFLNVLIDFLGLIIVLKPERLKNAARISDRLVFVTWSVCRHTHSSWYLQRFVKPELLLLFNVFNLPTLFQSVRWAIKSINTELMR